MAILSHTHPLAGLEHAVRRHLRRARRRVRRLMRWIGTTYGLAGAITLTLVGAFVFLVGLSDFAPELRWFDGFALLAGSTALVVSHAANSYAQRHPRTSGEGGRQ
jgi:Kef-type K+ transport system membrane component KefB